MATIANLKTAFTADTSGLKKGSDEAKSAIRDFEKVGNESLSALADQFGLNTAQIEKLSNAGKGAAMQLTKLFSGASQQASGLASTIGAVSGGLAALGVAAIVTTWKELNAEADHFYTSLEGAPVKAGFDTWKSTLKDIVTELGNANKTAEQLQQNSKNWGQLGQTVRAMFKGLIGQTSTGDWGFGGIMDNMIALNSATKKAEEAQAIAQRISELAQQTALSQRKIRDYDADIAENKRKAKDETYSIAERQNAVAEASRLINERASFLVPILQEQADLQNELNSFTYTSLEDQMKVENLLGNISDLRRSAATQSMELLEVQRKIANEAKKEAEAYQLSLKAVEAIKIFRQESSALSSAASGISTLFNGKSPTVSVTPEWEKGSLNELTESMRNAVSNTELQLQLKTNGQNFINELNMQAQQFGAAAEQIASSVISDLSAIFGQMMAGTMDMDDGVFAILGSVCTRLGEVCIAIGVACSGIRAAIEQAMNSPVAAIALIAAGAALVAIGSFASASVKSIANGGGVTGSYSSSTGYTPNSNLWNYYGGAQQSIKVEGELKLKNSQLVAAIKNAERTKYLTE